ncbi:hypothetical protein C7212DRAFT_223814 [Tuber magnatum]|uniref:Uncharacterized protein n=1 Tax=Tuber magnatum TaxID=42249 RepID=A0A317SIA1_9PEZI|nr:hypothetical protein C7212DRAFT_223814 [Tuber magnatum]
MSGISTVAIKDGHEGNRRNADANSLAADRLARLGAGTGGGYFDMLPAPRTGSAVSSAGGRLTPLTPYSPHPSHGGYTSAPSDKESLVQGRNSPASSTTTSSVAEARKEARLISGMTYDDSVIDTTNRSPIPVLTRAGTEETEAERRKRLERERKAEMVNGVRGRA